MRQRFPWKRYWCPPDGKLQLEETGFLVDPEDLGKYVKLDTVSFEKIQNTPCLILLGEPGIGKSIAIETELEALKQRLNSKTDLLLHINLKDYSSEEYLNKSIFESEGWKNFMDAKHTLHLFFDSLDEVRVRIDNITRLITKEIAKAPRDRLFLRIACRTADWPLSFQTELSRLWGKDEVRIYELAPLRLADVRNTLELLGINTDSFLQAVEERNVGVLASKPVTLNFLLNLFQKNGHLPKSSFELYELGTLLLCEEPDIERREKGELKKEYIGLFSAEQRLAVASRIAAVMAFSAKVAIRKDLSHEELREGTITLNELSGGKEKLSSGTFNISEDAIRETLGTGLFTSRGENYFGFAHQTYMEFLAACYLKDAPFEQLKGFLFHPHNDDKVIPQLQETAVWMSGMRLDVFSWIINSEPEILLRTDVAIFNDDIRGRLVAALLQKIKEEQLFDHWSFYKYYRKLCHPKLSQQLESIIKNKALSFILRRAAIDIAEACNEKDLLKVLATLALDEGEQYYIRTQAAHAVWTIGDDDIQEKLEPLACGLAGDDPDDELRALGMRCLWPKKWTLVQLLKNITPPRKDFLIGAYKMFLSHDAVAHLQKKNVAEDLPEALSMIKKWKVSKTSYSLSYFAELYDEIIRLAWDMIPDNRIMEGLSEVIIARKKEYQPIVSTKEEKQWDDLTSDGNKRQFIVTHIVEKSEADEKVIGMLSYRPTPLVCDSDFAWLLEQIETASPSKQALWAILIMNTLNYDHPTDWISKFLEVHSRVPILQEKYPTFWGLDSELSRQAKAHHLMRLRWEKRSVPKKPRPSIQKKTMTALQEIEQGYYEKWQDLTYFLSLNQETGELNSWPTNIKEMPLWKTLDGQCQQRVEEAAKQFLLNCNPGSDEWFGKGSYSWRSVAVHTAIFLACANEEIFLNISDDTWKKWIPYMVDSYITFHNSELYCFLFRLAYEKAPTETRQYFVRLIEAENERNGHILFINHLKNCWNHDLDLLIVESLGSSVIKNGSFEDLVDFMVAQGIADAEDTVVGRLSKFNKGDNLSKDIFLQAIVLVLTYWGEKYWARICEIFAEYPDSVAEIIARIANGRNDTVGVVNNLSEAHLAEFYYLTCQKYPHEEDPKIEGVHMVGTRELIVDLRQAIVSSLVNKGTKAALAAIEFLINKLPNQRLWLIWKLREAESITLKKIWLPPSPTQIISTLQDRTRRYVENEEQLLAVVIESLQRMQTYFHGISKPAIRLWNYDGSGTHRSNFRPKDEEDLSDEIMRWLSDDLGTSKGILVNREVQPQRGQKTDIYVNAVKLATGDNKTDILIVVIEVKGCWHSELNTAMENQLFNIYMRENKLSHGLYLVGWFLCDRWDDRDTRKKVTPPLTVDQLKERLMEQAKQLMKKNSDADIKSFVLDMSL